MIKLNMNPKGIKAGDCAIRAICYATEQDWDDVYNDLCKIGFKMKRMPNEKQVFEKYLKHLGWYKQKQPRKSNGFKYTVDEFAESMPRNVYIVTVASHMTAIAGKEIIDTWNCGYKSVGNYWIKERK